MSNCPIFPVGDAYKDPEVMRKVAEAEEKRQKKKKGKSK